MNIATNSLILDVRVSDGDLKIDETSDISADDSECFDQDIIDSCFEAPYIKEHYTDFRKIGSGGFGSVYEARHKLDNVKYALKFVLIDSETFCTREIEALASMDHKNIVRYHTSMKIELYEPPICPTFLLDNDEDSDGILFEKGNSSNSSSNASACSESDSSRHKSKEKTVTLDACLIVKTELCSTEKNLKTLIETGEIFIEDRRRRNLFLDVILGVQYIHDKGFMHRDLKPPNVLIGKDGRAKIGDFGLARRYITSVAEVDCPTSEKDGIFFTKYLGTVPYVAPEVLKSKCPYDRKADLYSIGMFLFEMYHKMGSKSERADTLQKLRDKDFAPLEKIPEKYKNVGVVVKSLLSHEPSLRMDLERVQELMSPLEHQQSVERIQEAVQPVSSTKTNYTGQARRKWCRRYK